MSRAPAVQRRSPTQNRENNPMQRKEPIGESKQLARRGPASTGTSTAKNLQDPAMTDFDPALHRMVSEQRWFEDFVLGERFVIPSRTQTSAGFAAFQHASGDTHPIHYDVEYCRARGMPDLLAHGFQTLVHTAPGAGLFPYLVEESMIGFLEP